MKKIFLTAFAVLFVWTGSAFAVDDDNRGSGLAFSTAEFDTSITAFDIDEAKLNLLKDEFLNNILAEGSIIGVDQLIDDIKNNEKFTEYLESKLENIYDALTDFVLNNEEIRKQFEDENGNVERNQVRDFFKSFVATEDIMDCLILSIVDADISEIKVDGDIGELMDKVYAEVERILNKENLDDLLNVIYNEVVGNLNENKEKYLHDIIYNEVREIVDNNNLENLFDEVYNKVIESINNDDIF